MTHPLQDLDGAKRHIFSARGQDFFLRVITTPQKFSERRDILDLISGRIMIDAQIELQADLNRQGDRGNLLEITNDSPTDKYDLAERGLAASSYNIAKIPTPLELENYKTSFVNYLGDQSNGTIFAIENSAREPLCAIYLTINDPAKRDELKVGSDVGNFVYVSDIMTAPRSRGHNIFSSAFDKIVTMLANPKHRENQSEAFQYAISVTAATELTNDGNQFYHIMNLPRYYKMWSDRFEDLSVMKRWQNISSGKQHAVGNPIPIAETYNEKAMSDFIEDQRETASLEEERERVRGVFLSGKMPAYEFAKEKRGELMTAREGKGITRNKTSEHGIGWLEKPQAVSLDQSQSSKQNQGRK